MESVWSAECDGQLVIRCNLVLSKSTNGASGICFSLPIITAGLLFAELGTLCLALVWMSDYGFLILADIVLQVWFPVVLGTKFRQAYLLFGLTSLKINLPSFAVHS